MRRTFKQGILIWLKQNFPQFHDKFRLELEREKYDKKWDEGIWAQDKGKKPDVLEVYFDNEFVTDIHDGMSRKEVWMRVINGLQKIKADREGVWNKKNANT